MKRHPTLRFCYGARGLCRTLDPRSAWYPCEVERRAAPRSSKNRLEELRYAKHDIAQLRGRRAQTTLPQEGLPLRLLRAYRGECRRHRKWEGFGNWCASALKGCAHGAGKDISAEGAIIRQSMNVEEIPHAAVCFTQHDHRMQLLRDRSLRAIGLQPRPRKFEQTWILQPFRFWDYGITDPDIDL